MQQQAQKVQKYAVNQHLIEAVLMWVKSGEIAVPEIQRPFVWKASKVRDLMDSLYQGYPVGYLIVWRNPNVRLKDGATAEGKKILIDGQQRVTALTAAILGQPIVNKDYKRTRIRIAFNPLEEKFEVLNRAISRDDSWLPDISKILTGDLDVFELVESYCAKNEGTDRKYVYKRIAGLLKIPQKQIGLIELDSDLDIETVTEIFIRINSQRVVLSQADFAMSKIAANEVYGGPDLRKCIDYFCHLAVAPEYYPQIAEGDTDFANTDYFSKITWLKNETDDLYDPSYTDLLRVAFTSEFERGKLSDLVSLLSGRNFEERTYEEEIAEASFASLRRGVLNFINETNFKRFVMIINSAGFISSKQIRSQNALNVAYMVYLKLRSLGYDPAKIESYVRRWFVLSVLTGRYSASAETQIEFDFRNVSKMDFGDILRNTEEGRLSDSFWEVGLIQRMDTSNVKSSYFMTYLAAQIKGNDKGFLSRDITVNDLVTHRGDMHHLFLRDPLKKKGLKRSQYNQIANFVYMQSEINIQIGKKAPNQYFAELEAQCNDGPMKYGGIDSMDMLRENLRANCIPDDIVYMDFDDYDDFLAQRRVHMAQKLREYYATL